LIAFLFDETGIEIRAICREAFVCILPSGHTLQDKARIGNSGLTITDYCEVPVITFATRRWSSIASAATTPRNYRKAERSKQFRTWRPQ